MTLVACLLGCDELGLWLADEPKRLRCATSMLSLMLLLNVDEITATIYEVIVRDEVRHATSRKWIDLVILNYSNDAVDYRSSIAPNIQVGT